MACVGTYAPLPCALTGVGFTKSPVTAGATVLPLMTGGASQFPELDPGQYFFATLTHGCNNCCEEVRVVEVRRATDELVVERQDGACECLTSNSRVRYETCSVRAIRAIAAEAAPEVQAPLVYDCDTHTIRIDCAQLKDMMARPCDEE